ASLMAPRERAELVKTARDDPVELVRSRATSTGPRSSAIAHVPSRCTDLVRIDLHALFERPSARAAFDATFVGVEEAEGPLFELVQSGSLKLATDLDELISCTTDDEVAGAESVTILAGSVPPGALARLDGRLQVVASMAGGPVVATDGEEPVL